ncbi:mannose-6-phosphate isomerase, class I [Demequina sp.]|uniref:mannose-6-phosphate isomerase, class I n=1 Tax=Demequina sp. TaxID=2050685 RepID=UPI0025C40CD3|nr:mannose-6-phosphate isomerase, class I [Demequina sp.]
MIALTPYVQRFDWGAPDGIPELLGIPSDGGPYAEAWWGAHPLTPSDTEEGPLDAVIARDPVAALGDDVAESFGRLPYLLKVLSIARPLSIQVHPTSEAACDGFAAEQAQGIAYGDRARAFKDPFHKPELLVAMTHMGVLVGFRPAADLRRDLESLGGAGALALTEALDAGGLAAYVTAALDGGHLDTVAALASLPEGGGGSLGAARLAAQTYPADPGVLVAFAMNAVSLAPGEAIFTPAGVVHCYLGGMGLEIMANSDNVVRAGLTSKPVNSELLRTLARLEHTRPIRPAVVAEGAVRHFSTDAEEFGLDIVVGGTAVVTSGPRIVLALGSDCLVVTEAESRTLAKGHAVFVPSSAGPVTVTSEGLTAIATAPLARR